MVGSAHAAPAQYTVDLVMSRAKSVVGEPRWIYYRIVPGKGVDPGALGHRPGRGRLVLGDDLRSIGDRHSHLWPRVGMPKNGDLFGLFRIHEKYLDLAGTQTVELLFNTVWARGAVVVQADSQTRNGKSSKDDQPYGFSLVPHVALEAYYQAKPDAREEMIKAIRAASADTGKHLLAARAELIRIELDYTRGAIGANKAAMAYEAVAEAWKLDRHIVGDAYLRMAVLSEVAGLKKERTVGLSRAANYHEIPMSVASMIVRIEASYLADYVKAIALATARQQQNPPQPEVPGAGFPLRPVILRLYAEGYDCEAVFLKAPHLQGDWFEAANKHAERFADDEAKMEEGWRKAYEGIVRRHGKKQPRNQVIDALRQRNEKATNGDELNNIMYLGKDMRLEIIQALSESRD